MPSNTSKKTPRKKQLRAVQLCGMWGWGGELQDGVGGARDGGRGQGGGMGDIAPRRSGPLQGGRLSR